MAQRTILAAAVALTLVGAPSHAHGVARFVHGRWFDGTSFVARESTYSVEGVLVSHYEGKVDRVVDLGNAYIVPPFADAHTHDLGGPDPHTVARFLRAGIFYAKNPNSLATLTDLTRPMVNTPESVDVIWALGGITSSGGHPIQIYDRVASHLGRDPASMENDAYWVVDSEQELAAKWPRILGGHPDFIKVYLERSERPVPPRTDAAWLGGHGLDPALLPAIVARAHAAGLRVTAHITSAADFRTAVEDGVDELAHLPLEPITDEDARAAARAGVVVVTTVLSHRPIPPGVDAMQVQRDNLRRLLAAGVRLAIGTDGPVTAVDEVDRLRSFGVFTPLQLLKLFVEETPQVIFPARKIGRLADGYEASFLALDSDPLVDPQALHGIALRVKKGHTITPTNDAEVPAAPGEGHEPPHAAPSPSANR